MFVGLPVLLTSSPSFHMICPARKDNGGGYRFGPNVETHLLVSKCYACWFQRVTPAGFNELRLLVSKSDALDDGSLTMYDNYEVAPIYVIQDSVSRSFTLDVRAYVRIIYHLFPRVLLLMSGVFTYTLPLFHGVLLLMSEPIYFFSSICFREFYS